MGGETLFGVFLLPAGIVLLHVRGEPSEGDHVVSEGSTKDEHLGQAALLDKVKDRSHDCRGLDCKRPQRATRHRCLTAQHHWELLRHQVDQLLTDVDD